MSVQSQIEHTIARIHDGDGSVITESLTWHPQSGDSVAGIVAVVQRKETERADSYQSDTDEQTADIQALTADMASVRIGDAVELTDGRWRISARLPAPPGAVRFRAARRISAVRVTA